MWGYDLVCWLGYNIIVVQVVTATRVYPMLTTSVRVIKFAPRKVSVDQFVFRSHLFPQCKCLEEGCECDPNSINPDELCDASEQCVNCQCLPEGKIVCPPFHQHFIWQQDFLWHAHEEILKYVCVSGCNCDENAADPDSFCPVRGEVCKVILLTPHCSRSVSLYLAS